MGLNKRDHKIINFNITSINVNFKFIRYWQLCIAFHALHLLVRYLVQRPCVCFTPQRPRTLGFRDDFGTTPPTDQSETYQLVSSCGRPFGFGAHGGHICTLVLSPYLRILGLGDNPGMISQSETMAYGDHFSTPSRYSTWSLRSSTARIFNSGTRSDSSLHSR